MTAAPDGDDASARSEPTVRTRMLGVGMSAERLAGHVERGTLQLDGETVTDLDAPAPPGTRIVFARS